MSFAVNHCLPANHRHAAPLAAPARRVAGTGCVRIAVENTAEKIAEVLDKYAGYDQIIIAARSPQPAARSPQPAARSPQPAARSPQPAARSPQPA
ncbi:hypothetical protein OpiT1DRAFT_01429 [Opitutaceae bacterium TAV1]|nr:hypothetical protein OpiT1DRAFT_01429 [Opitutaceae bacterium TAV1]